MVNLIISVIITYLTTSIWETFVHWKILHASKKSRLQWRRRGGIFNLMRKGYFSHNVIHHRKTYKNNHFIQFESHHKKALLDAKLQPKFGCHRYGVTVSGFWELFVFTSIPLTLSTITFIALAPKFLPLGIIIAISPLLLSKYLHPLLHENFTSKLEQNTFKAWVTRSHFFNFIQHYHFIHHKYGLCNFNLLPGGDFLMQAWKSTQNSNIKSGSYQREP